nr:MAG TPA: hypothetical protein [Caudoviricetes sp.]
MKSTKGTPNSSSPFFKFTVGIQLPLSSLASTLIISNS